MLYCVGAHREEDLLRLLDGALVLIRSTVRLGRCGAGAGEPLDRGLELVQRALLLALLPLVGRRRRGRVPVGLLLEGAAPQEGRTVGGCVERRAAEAAVHGEVDDRGGGGHGTARWIRIRRSLLACSLVCDCCVCSSPFCVCVLCPTNFGGACALHFNSH